MVNRNSGHSILEYLQKNGATNTFKLAHALGIKRDNLLGILKNLEEQRLVKIATGKVEFLSYPVSKEKSSRTKPLASSAKRKREKQKPKVSKKRIEKKPEDSKEKLETDKLKKGLEEKNLEIRKLKNKIKELQEAPPTEPVVEKVKTEEIKPKPKRKKEIKIKKVKPRKKKSKEKKRPLPKHKPKKTRKIKKFKLKLPKLKIPKIRFKKSFKKLPRLKIKGALGLFGVKKFIKHLKRR